MLTTFANLKISAKIYLLIGVLSVAMAAMVALGLYFMHAGQARSNGAIDTDHQLMYAVDRARSIHTQIRLQVQEFKNILLRGQDKKSHDHYTVAFHQRADLVHKELMALREQTVKLQVAAGSVDDVIRAHQEITQEYAESLEHFVIGKPETAQIVDSMVAGIDRRFDGRFDQLIKTLASHAEETEAQLLAENNRAARAAMLTMLALLMAAVALAVVAGRQVARGVAQPIEQVAEAARRVAAGDLTVRFDSHAGGEAGDLMRSLTAMADGLQQIVGEVSRGARTVAQTSAQIAHGNTDLSQRTEEQARTLEETASSMEELTSTVTHNADRARQASQLASTASEVARRGGKVMHEVVDTMSGISEHSRRISEISSVIDGIAFQTNILALNAAVEAARAGEQGRGFAVVAGEVRTLAQSSAASAKEIKKLIDESGVRVQGGTRLVEAAGRTIDEIVGTVGQVNDLIAEIAAASREQATGIGQVNTAVVQMEQVVQQNAALVEEGAAATEAMKAQANGLLALVARFRLEDGGDGTAPAAAATDGPLQAPALQPIRVRGNSIQPIATHPPAASRPARAAGPGAVTSSGWQSF